MLFAAVLVVIPIYADSAIIKLPTSSIFPSRHYDKYVHCDAKSIAVVSCSVSSIGLVTAAAAAAAASSIQRSRYDTSDSGSFYDRDLTAVNQTRTYIRARRPQH